MPTKKNNRGRFQYKKELREISEELGKIKEAIGQIQKAVGRISLKLRN